MSERPPTKFGDILAFHGSGFVSWRIRRATNGWCNHVAFCFDDKTCWQATFDKGLHKALIAPMIDAEPCVILRPRSALGLDYSPTDDQFSAAVALFTEEEGAGYDFMGIAGLLFFSFRNHWQAQSRWFCSEYTLAASERAGIRPHNGLIDPGSWNPTEEAASSVRRAIWHSLPDKVAAALNLAGVPHK
jgi:hypothetical protein